MMKMGTENMKLLVAGLVDQLILSNVKLVT